MKVVLPKLNTATKNFLRLCGYLEIQNPHNQELSFARSLDPGRFYPRFHIYPEEGAKQLILNLHLDAKRPSYGNFTAHSGEYDGAVVESEAERVKKISEKFTGQNYNPEQPLGFKKKKSWLEKLFPFFGKK